MKKTTKVVALLFLSIFISFSSPFVFARGGGGGSFGGGFGGGFSSGGGGGSYGGSSYSSSPEYQHGKCYSTVQNQTEAECEHDNFVYRCVGLIFIFAQIVFLLLAYLRQKGSIVLIYPRENQDPILSEKTKEVYFLFQKAWSEFDTATMQKITTQKYYNQLVLELAVLKNEKRENRMTDVQLLSAYVDSTTYNRENPISTLTSFRAEVVGKAHDTLFDTELQQELYTDTSTFTEYWDFILQDNEWKLCDIREDSEDYYSLDIEIEEFSEDNNFFYNPDFGWLMIPNKGVLFSQSSFKTTDINNHVIGVYKNKIVEFYTIIFTVGGPEYFIGQAILPKTYNRILVRKKSSTIVFDQGVSGLRKLELESLDFNKEFDVYSDNADTMTTFELLHPAFMEYIMGLPYDVSIEVVGNTLYFYTTTATINYARLLEILSRAFDEIKE